ncbi:MAG: hypothetical protein IKW81_02485, partial [Pseudobutyrivibrio sp.]|nr:hypothetical protein [Pseudobutyrivibrio sp.]
MTYKEIFKEIVSIMEKDSATYPDYGAGDYKKYAQNISDDMDKMKFLHIVQDYLSTFKVYAHLSFYDSTVGNLGFTVMRYEDCLYVTKANKGTGLVPGDKIIFIDSMSITEVAEKEKNMLMGESKEREGLHWPAILKFYKTLTVKHSNNETEDIAIKLGTKSEETPKYYYKNYGNDTLYMRLKDFSDLENIGKLYADCEKELDTCNNLIIDVRENGGGADSGFYPLIEYSFPADEPANKYINIEYPIAVNYS